jgi:hypothetical protein
MYLFQWFRSFLPLHNPIGFGASDFLELFLVLLLVVMVIARPWVIPAAQKLARKPVWSMLALFALVIVLRLALLPMHPVPTASGADDFSYLLLGDTLAHFRLANSTHAMYRFFETTFVLQRPSYSSIYALGQGLALAFGQLLFGSPWAGVLISMALISALCYWMLRGWTSPGWALVGGLIAACQFGPLNSWMNTYWGGAISAIAGCLVYGALPRLRDRGLTRDAVVLGAGIGLQMITRPYESLFLDASVVLFFLPDLLRKDQWRLLARRAAPALFALVPLAGLQLLHNHAVTGSWTTLPYALSRYQYGVPTTFTFQPNAVAHNELTQAQQLYYEGQAAVHGNGDSVGGYFARLGSRTGFYRFFFPTVLLPALLFFLLRLREFRYAWVAVTCALFALGTNFYPYFFPQYIGALTCLFVLMCIAGLERMEQVKGGAIAARWLVVLCFGQFVFWYGVHAQHDQGILRSMSAWETGDGINTGDPESRIAINRQLEQAPGKHLVFVRYYSDHRYHEWIHNAADIDNSRVVWALDLGGDNDKLKAYFPDRKVWLMLPDALPPRLAPYPATQGMFEDVQ